MLGFQASHKGKVRKKSISFRLRSIQAAHCKLHNRSAQTLFITFPYHKVSQSQSHSQLAPCLVPGTPGYLVCLDGAFQSSQKSCLLLCSLKQNTRLFWKVFSCERKLRKQTIDTTNLKYQQNKCIMYGVISQNERPVIGPVRHTMNHHNSKEIHTHSITRNEKFRLQHAQKDEIKISLLLQ